MPLRPTGFFGRPCLAWEGRDATRLLINRLGAVALAGAAAFSLSPRQAARMSP
jgi:hypothetical protein